MPPVYKLEGQPYLFVTMATVVLTGPVQYTRTEPLTQFVAKHCKRCAHG